jgi:hypothetical protein
VYFSPDAADYLTMPRRVIAIFGLFSLAASAADRPLILGALEEFAYEPDQPLRRTVRALFERTDNGWHARFANTAATDRRPTPSQEPNRIRRSGTRIWIGPAQ